MFSSTRSDLKGNNDNFRFIFFQVDQISNLKVWDLQVYLKWIYYLWFKGKLCRFFNPALCHCSVGRICRWAVFGFPPCCRRPELLAHLSTKVRLMIRAPARRREVWHCSFSWTAHIVTIKRSVKYPLSAIKLKQPLNTIMIVLDVSCIDCRQQLSYGIQGHLSRMLHFTRYIHLYSAASRTFKRSFNAGHSEISV